MLSSSDNSDFKEWFLSSSTGARENNEFSGEARINDDDDDLFHRPGRFSIAVKTIKDSHTLGMDHNIVMEIMASCIITEAKYNYVSGFFEYWGYSYMFKKIENGTIVPHYAWSVHKDSDGSLHVSARHCSI